MVSQIQSELKKEMFEAVKSGDHDISGIIQIVLAQMKNAQIDKGDELTSEEEIDLLKRESKRLQDAADQFGSAGREDLQKQSLSQKEYLSKYLPILMSKEEVEAVVDQVIAENGATSSKDMGKVMGATMSKLQGKADGSLVKDVVISKLK